MTEWRPVVGYEGLYEISSEGLIKSLPRMTTGVNGTPRRVLEKILKGRGAPDRYVSVRLVDASGSGKTHNAHVLLLEAFVGPRPHGMQALHRDDVKNHNTVSNPYWGTYADNARDKMENGRNGNANKVRCINGHDYTPENTYIDSRGHRNCMVCRQASWHRAHERWKARRGA